RALLMRAVLSKPQRRVWVVMGGQPFFIGNTCTFFTTEAAGCTEYLSRGYNPPMFEPAKRPSFLRRLLALFGWRRSSSVLLGGFFLLCGLIVYVWWPLAQAALATINWKGAWWLELDWLLL